MLDPLDRHSRDSTLFQFTTKRLRDFIDPNHLLIQIDEQFDFQKLVEPLEDYYCRDNGRPAIHPEVLVRALLISSLYNVNSFRRLCAAISENLAFRWFCFLTIDDEVFNHSTISYFIERVVDSGVSGPSQTYCFDRQCARCSIGRAATSVAVSYCGCSLLPVCRQYAPGMACAQSHQYRCLLRRHISSQ